MTTLKTVKQLFQGKQPGQLIIQITDKCNATCPQCSMRVSENFKRSSLGVDQCLEMVDKAAERGVSALSITGGEPLLYLPELIKIISHGHRAGIPYTRTGTNGFTFRNPEAPDFDDRVRKCAEMLAKSPLRNFWISIDSAVPETHEKMRGFKGVIKGIEKALPIFHQYNLYPTANLGLNRNLGGDASDSILTKREPLSASRKEEFIEAVEQGLSDFFKLVANLGFTIVNFCYPMSIEVSDNLEAVYPASSPDYIVSFTKEEKAWLFEAMLSTIPKFRSSLRIFSPLSALHTLCKHYRGEEITPFPCRGGKDYFFINAGDGHTYPCGYRGMDDLGDYRTTIPQLQKKEDCLRCDWECFRDPSEFLGPISYGLSSPLSLFTKHRRDKQFYKLWFKDLSYYKACEFFDGRKNIVPEKIAKFSNTPVEAAVPMTQPIFNAQQLEEIEQKHRGLSKRIV